MENLYIAVPLGGAAAVLLITALTEWIHSRRARKAAKLAFGPRGKALGWTTIVPVLRALCMSVMMWSLLTLLLEHFGVTGGGIEPKDSSENVFLVLDFSPSMMLEDSGPDSDITRKQRMRDVVNALVDRLGEHVHYSIICFQSRTYPICEKVFDKEVVRNMLNDLPIEIAMEKGPTDLGRAINESLELAAAIDGKKPRYKKKSITYVLVTDGDSLEIEALNRLPKSIKKAFVLGVGNTEKGIAVGGHYSRQEPLTLRYLARHLGGEYINVNEKHLPSSVMGSLRAVAGASAGEGISRSDMALILFAIMTVIYALVPVLQEFVGSDWKLVSRPRGQENIS